MIFISLVFLICQLGLFNVKYVVFEISQLNIAFASCKPIGTTSFGRGGQETGVFTVHTFPGRYVRRRVT